MLAQTPEPPYYAVIFASTRKECDYGYSAMSAKMLELAKEQLGFLGVDSARSDIGITVSYWKDLASINLWREHTEHKVAKEKGKADWYQYYTLRIAKVELMY
jgi:heme-degrading monooxygenase HmoA